MKVNILCFLLSISVYFTLLIQILHIYVGKTRICFMTQVYFLGGRLYQKLLTKKLEVSQWWAIDVPVSCYRDVTGQIWAVLLVLSNAYSWNEVHKLNGKIKLPYTLKWTSSWGYAIPNSSFLIELVHLSILGQVDSHMRNRQQRVFKFTIYSAQITSADKNAIFVFAS